MSRPLLDALTRELGAGRLEPHFQPVVALGDRRVVSYESLVRWRGEDGVLCDALTVRSAAARNGLLGDVSCIMAKLAMDAFAQGCSCAQTAVSVNASALDLAGQEFATAIGAALTASRLSPTRLWIEITEDEPLLNASAVVRTLEELRGQGVRISLDDFGVGYSSLSWLLALPLDGLKMDRRFVAGIAQAGREHTIAAHIVSLARALTLEVIAEGVETEEDAAALAALGCPFGQGRLFGMPGPAGSAFQS